MNIQLLLTYSRIGYQRWNGLVNIHKIRSLSYWWRWAECGSVGLAISWSRHGICRCPRPSCAPVRRWAAPCRTLPADEPYRAAMLDPTSAEHPSYTSLWHPHCNQPIVHQLGMFNLVVKSLASYFYNYWQMSGIRSLTLTPIKKIDYEVIWNNILIISLNRVHMKGCVDFQGKVGQWTIG